MFCTDGRGPLRVEHVPVQPAEGFLHPGKGQGQVHPHRAGAVEHPAVLDGDAHRPGGLFHVVDGLAVGRAPLGAVHKQHIGAFGPGRLDPFKMLPDVIAGIVDVARKHLAQLVHPDLPFGPVGAGQGVHGQDVHVVVMAFGRPGAAQVPQAGVVDDVVAAHQPRQIEGLAGGVEGDGPAAGVGADALSGGVLVAVQQDVGPDLVRDDHAAVGLVHRHGLFQLFPGPDAAAGVVGAAQDGHMDVVLLQFAVHVGVVHPPHALLVPDQGRVDDPEAVVLQGPGKADVGGAVDQHRVAGACQAGQGRDDPAQDAVFVPDAVPGQQGGIAAVALHLPLDDGVVVGVGGLKIAVGGVAGPLHQRLGDGGHGGEIHVRHPHGDGVEAVPGGVGGKAGVAAQAIHGDGILAAAVQDGSEIVAHRGFSFAVCEWFGTSVAQGGGPVNRDIRPRPCAY